MRRRLVAGVLLGTLALLACGLFLRGQVLDNALRETESERIVAEAQTAAALVDQQLASGGEVDERLLTVMSEPSNEVVYTPQEGSPTTMTGDDFNAEDVVAASIPTAQGMMTIRRTPVAVGSLWSRYTVETLSMLFLLGLLAVVGSGLLAHYLARPFRRLSMAATQLGRGRFDIDLPRFSVSEAKQIAAALSTSGKLLRDRVERERQFAAHVSHELRSRLTGLRFRLEEARVTEQQRGESTESIDDCLRSVDKLTETVEDLVALARRGALVDGAEIPLRDLATGAAQSWADRLAKQNRMVTASIDGELDQTFTPGPIEYVLDELLAAVVVLGEGDVRMKFDGSSNSVRVRVTTSSVVDSVDSIKQAEAVVETLGGRMDRMGEGQEISVTLPRR